MSVVKIAALLIGVVGYAQGYTVTLGEKAKSLNLTNAPSTVFFRMEGNIRPAVVSENFLILADNFDSTKLDPKEVIGVPSNSEMTGQITTAEVAFPENPHTYLKKYGVNVAKFTQTTFNTARFAFPDLKEEDIKIKDEVLFTITFDDEVGKVGNVVFEIIQLETGTVKNGPTPGSFTATAKTELRKGRLVLKSNGIAGDIRALIVGAVIQENVSTPGQLTFTVFGKEFQDALKQIK